MEEHFSRLVDYDFTASMEEDLDAIARGDQERVVWLRRFYFGDESSTAEGLRDLVADLGDIDARAISTIEIGDGIVVRVGRYGPYVEEVVPAGVDAATGEVTDATAADAAPAQPRRATINDDVAPDEMTPEKARELLDAAADDGRVLGHRPGHGPRDRRPRRPLRPVRHRGPARGRRPRPGEGQEGRGEGPAAHGLAVQGHGPRDDRARHRAAAALAAARRRHGRPRRTAPRSRSPRRTGATGRT